MKKSKLSENTAQFLNFFLSFLRGNDKTTISDIDNHFNVLSEEEKEEFLNFKDTINDGLLMKSIHFRNEEACLWLIKKDISLDSDNNSQKSPLIQAIINELTLTALALINKGCDINYVISSFGKKIGDNALIYACDYNNFQVINALLENNIDINYCNEFGRNALFFCITNKTSETDSSKLSTFKKILPLLLQDIEKKDNFGFSIIDMIVRYGTKDYFDILFEHQLFKNTEFDISANSESNHKDINEKKVREELIQYWKTAQLTMKLNDNLNQDFHKTEISKRKI